MTVNDELPNYQTSTGRCNSIEFECLIEIEIDTQKFD